MLEKTSEIFSCFFIYQKLKKTRYFGLFYVNWTLRTRKSLILLSFLN